MRRKFINTNSLIFIILIAIFTLTSYVCDQGVIRQEDNIRKSVLNEELNQNRD